MGQDLRDLSLLHGNYQICKVAMKSYEMLFTYIRHFYVKYSSCIEHIRSLVKLLNVKLGFSIISVTSKLYIISYLYHVQCLILDFNMSDITISPPSKVKSSKSWLQYNFHGIRFYSNEQSFDKSFCRGQDSNQPSKGDAVASIVTKY